MANQMLRKYFHWVEGLIVAALMCAITWMNSPVSALDSFAGSNPYDARLNTGSGTNKGKQDEDQKRIREGTEVVGRSGHFRQDGDGAIFITDDGYELGGLPNLNLERIVRTLKTADDSSTIRWRVSGNVTEFSGRNYLFITRAVYKAKTPPPVPAQLSAESSADK